MCVDICVYVCNMSTCACVYISIYMYAWVCKYMWGRDVAQAVGHPPLKFSIIRSILHSRCVCCLDYFPFQPMVQNWSVKGCDMCCPVCEKVHIKDAFLLIGKISLCGDSHCDIFSAGEIYHNDYMFDVQ